MSEAQVFVNGRKVCLRPYRYNSFWCDVTDNLREGGNELAVLLENRSQSSLWYLGAGGTAPMGPLHVLEKRP